MALFNFCYYVAVFFLGLFWIFVCIAGLIAGIVCLVLLFTPFPYFPEYRKFMIRFWTFGVTALFFDDSDYLNKEWTKIKEELKVLASWDSAKAVVHEKK